MDPPKKLPQKYQSQPQDEKPKDQPQKEQPNFRPSGNLVNEGCYYKGIYLKWDNPQDVCLPKAKWRIYVLKGDDIVEEPIQIHKNTSFLFGRDKRIADIPIQHLSTSMQHAVLHFRLIDVIDKDSKTTKRVKPFIVDLNSTNGTFLNGEKLVPNNFYEIREKDIVKFGQSTRDYVFLTEESVSTEGNKDKEYEKKNITGINSDIVTDSDLKQQKEEIIQQIDKKKRTREEGEKQDAEREERIKRKRRRVDEDEEKEEKDEDVVKDIQIMGKEKQYD
ncbi:MAG: putative smad nuclear-interacting protein 1 [Streblomastix strix]|uniref:Putative smad nuclear-interacting protein 1 n=1 Tax=Streblomastix strix TaxID=222440 RepID=A0A5J4WYU3_9EUKA|nr:MAG: putative smad nuclear-interacting protein 1 [Streblomastix strix]